MSAVNKYTLVPFILILTMAGAELATDMYLPSLTAIADYYGSTDKITNLTLSMNFLGVAIARPFYGFLCDCYGRRSIMILGTVIFFVATLFCISPSTMTIFIIARFFQGIGEAVGWVVGLAILRDIYADRESYTRVMSVMRAVMAMFPALGPVLGAWIAYAWNWQATFIFMSGFAFLIAGMVVFKLPETLAPERRHTFSVRSVASNYLTILRNWQFLGNVLISSFGLAGIWVFMSISPVLYVDQFGFTKRAYSYLLFLGVAAYVGGSLYNRRYSSRFSAEDFLSQGIFLLLTSAGFLLLLVMIDPVSPYLIRIFTALYMAAMALVFTSTALRALEVFPTMSGSASALMGGIELLTATTFMLIARVFLDERAAVAMAVLIFGAAVVGAGILYTLEKKPVKKAS